MIPADYIAPMSETTRRMAIVGLGAAAMVCWSAFVAIFAIAIVLVPNDPKAPIGPILGSVAILGCLALTTTWMAIRLIHRKRAKNGITTMPEWFIQIFGIFLLLGIVVMAILKRNVWLVGEGIGIAIAMLAIRSMVRQRQTEVLPNPQENIQEPR